MRDEVKDESKLTMNTWHELLTNVAIVAIMTSVWTVVQRYVVKFHPYARSLLFGFLLALGIAGVMLLPVKFSTGVLLDLRYTFLVLAGFFGGPVATILPGGVALALRIQTGGTGMWVGIPQIVIAIACGLIGFWKLKGSIPEIRHILALALGAAFSGTAGFFVMIPVARWAIVIPYVTLPLAALLFVATTVAALAMANELRRQHATNENRLYRAIIEALPDCLNAKDIEGRFIAANPATAALMNAATVKDLIGKTDFDFYSSETALRFRQDEQILFEDAKPIAVEQRFKRANGPDIWLSTLKAPLFDEAGALVGLITHNREITEQKKLEIRLSEAQRHLADALANMADGLVMHDREGTMLFCNEQYRAQFPLTADVRVPGASMQSIMDAARERGEFVTSTLDEADVPYEQRGQILAKSGDYEITLADGRILKARSKVTGDGSCLFVFSDVTKARQGENQLRLLNEQLESMANTDGLTGLLNRRAFDRLLQESILDAARTGSPFALLLIDIDCFKAFNDTYGHPEGDKCLRMVADCLSGAVRDFGRGFVARYGGEEIGIILPDTDEAIAVNLAELLRVAIKDINIDHSGSEKKVVTISIGVAAGDIDGQTSSADFLRRADEGLYAAKAAGRDRVRAPRRPEPLAGLPLSA